MTRNKPLQARGERSKRNANRERELRERCLERHPECVAFIEGVRHVQGLPEMCCGHLLHECEGHLDTAHILSKKSHPKLRFEGDCVVTLCRRAHEWFTVHPKEWEVFVESHFPGRLQALRDKENGL